MAGAGYRNWTAGEKPTGDQFDQYLQEQTNMVFATTSARDTALSVVKAEGMKCYVTATDRWYTYDGTNWIVTGTSTATGRVGCSLQRAANQSINTNTLTAISWDQEDFDSDAFITAPSGTITIPSGMGGVYSISAQAFCSTAWGGNVNDQLLLSVGGIDFYFGTQAASNGSKTAALVIPLSATNTISFWVKHNIGSASNFIGRIYVYRLTP